MFGYAVREPSALIFLKNQPHCTHRKHNKDYAPKALRCSARGCAFAFPPRDAHRVAEDKRVGMLAEVVFYERAEMLFLFVKRVAQRSLSHHYAVCHKEAEVHRVGMRGEPRCGFSLGDVRSLSA